MITEKSHNLTLQHGDSGRSLTANPLYKIPTLVSRESTQVTWLPIPTGFGTFLADLGFVFACGCMQTVKCC